MEVKFTDEQQAVIDARKCNLLVSAAAGSGKTAVLVERIIQMVLEGTDIDHLLVVTFTKAAASQMREKITLAIQKKLQTDPDNEHLQKQETLIHNAQITTIDSFCQYVLRNNFNQIGVDPSFHVADDGELALLQDEIMQEMLEEEYRKAKEGNNEEFLYCMNYFSTGRNDKNAEEYISQLYRFSMSMPWPEDWVNERARDYDVQDREFDELGWVKECVESIRRRLKEASDKTSVAISLCNDPDGPYMYGDMLQAEKDSIDATLQYDTYDALFDGVRGISFARLSSKKDDSVSVQKREYAKSLRDDVKEIIKSLLEKYLAFPSDIVLEQMGLCDRAVKELCRLTIQFKNRLDERKRDNQVIDFSDMEHFALQILVEHPDEEACRGLTTEEIISACKPSKVALEYREFYREVLIDEYQDSNNVQELILRSIAGNDADVSECFMVGDVKQSIYKFRLARPEIFMDKLVSYSKEKGAADRRIDLHMNFRSRSEVLDITNYIFDRIMAPDLGGVDYDQDARLVKGGTFDEPVLDMTPELILVEPSEEAKEEEAHAVALKIRQLRQEDTSLKYKDIVVLLRSASGWDDIFKSTLEKHGIPAHIESKNGYFDAWEVTVLIQLLNVIDNPTQDIPLVSVMHSMIGGFTDEDLAKLRIDMDSFRQKDEEISFYQGLKLIIQNDEDKEPELYAKVQEFVTFIEDCRDRVTYTPVHELLEMIIDRTGFDMYVNAMPAGAQRRANIDLLMSKAETFEKTSFKGLFHFIRYIEHIRMVEVDYGEAGIIDENADVVRIMSIHKSKGLEFPVVFVSGLSKQFNLKDTRKDMIMDMDLGIGVKCIDSDIRAKYDTLKRRIIADKLKEDSLGEELRVLYVALTRAKEKLIMTGSLKSIPDRIAKELDRLPVIAGDGDKACVLPFSMRIGAMSYMDYILGSLIRHPGMEEIIESVGLPKDIYDAYRDKSEEIPPLKVTALHGDDLLAAQTRDEVMAFIRKEDILADYDRELADRIKEKFGYRYQYDFLKGLFTKTTVTELKKHLLEEEGETFATIPEYVRESEIETGLSGADRGSAYHKAMELLDADIYGDSGLMSRCGDGDKSVSDDVGRWIHKAAETGIISKDYAEAVDPSDIVTFLSTDLGQRMGAAYRDGRLYREKPFMMGVSAGELDSRFPESEMVLIQGIIDAWFYEGDDIVLMDYKTDRVRSGDELVKRYAIQLQYYKRALENSTGRKVKEIYIYSFALGTQIPLEIAIDKPCQ